MDEAETTLYHDGMGVRNERRETLTEFLHYNISFDVKSHEQMVKYKWKIKIALDYIIGSRKGIMHDVEVINRI